MNYVFLKDKTRTEFDPIHHWSHAFYKKQIFIYKK